MSGNNLKVALVLSLVFNVAVIGAVVYGFAGGGRRGERRVHPAGTEALGRRCTRLCRGLGVSEKRGALFSRAMAKSSDEMRETRLRLEDARAELIDLIRAPQPDEKTIMAKVDEISSLQGELEKKLIQRLLSASCMLSPEERERLMHHVGRRYLPLDRVNRNGPGFGAPGTERGSQPQEVPE
jgi:uncharacterized membrane protein